VKSLLHERKSISLYLRAFRRRRIGGTLRRWRGGQADWKGKEGRVVAKEGRKVRHSLQEKTEWHRDGRKRCKIAWAAVSNLANPYYPTKGLEDMYLLSLPSVRLLSRLIVLDRGKNASAVL